MRAGKALTPKEKIKLNLNLLITFFTSMGNITAKLVKDLRDKTGAGMMDCKKALNETDGNLDKALEWLRKKGIASAEKKSGRVAAEGSIGSYIHTGSRAVSYTHLRAHET